MTLLRTSPYGQKRTEPNYPELQHAAWTLLHEIETMQDGETRVLEFPAGTLTIMLPPHRKGG